MNKNIVKLFGKTFATWVTFYCSGLLLEMNALASDSLVTKQPSVSHAPALRSGVGLPPPITSDDPTKVKLSDRLTSVDPTLDETLSSESSADTTSIEQVNSVSQLSDVQPTDWAFQALQSLVERYGCIAGYPNGTYLGNRALTRYEFAAGVNACLNRVNELIATATSDLVAKSDLVTLQKLQEQFATELAALRSRVDVVSAHTASLEQNRFSTTTQFKGLLVTHLANAFGDNAGKSNSTVLQYEAFLGFYTSFTGKDTLTVSLTSGNTQKLDTATKFPQGRLSGGTDETRFLVSSNETYGNATVGLGQLQYHFPASKTLDVFVDAYSSDRLYSAPISPLNNMLTGALSFYGKINPMFYPISPQTSLGAEWKVAPWLNLDLTLSSDLTANNPTRGLSKSGYGAFIEPVFNFGRLKLSASYINSYSPSAGIDTLSGSNAAKVIGAGPVVGNTYVGGIFYRFSPLFEMGGSFGYSNARALGNDTRGDAHVSDYRVNLIFYDVGKKGNLAGLILGTEPRLVGTSNAVLAQAIGLPPGQRSDRNVGFHIEAFYSHQLTDNITITPGFFWLTAPNHDARNPDVVVGVIRTSFTF